jgi:hypothetical protein
VPKTIRYGIFGGGTIERDDEGFIEVPIILEEGEDRPELRINTFAFHGDDDFNRAYVAKLNRQDSRFALTTARVKVRLDIRGEEPTIEDVEGFVTLPVITQDSGLFAGAPPAELCIHQVFLPGQEEERRDRVAELNQRTDLPFYVATALVNIVGDATKITDEDLAAAGIEPLPDDKQRSA